MTALQPQKARAEYTSGMATAVFNKPTRSRLAFVRLLTITPNRIAYSWCLGPLGSRLSAKHAVALTKKLGTADPYEQLHSLPSVQRGLNEIETRPASGRLPQQLESLALRIGQKRRTGRELASLLAVIQREWPKAQSLQPIEV